MQISPPEDELRRAILDLKSQHPALGISKVHAYLLAMYPQWTVSEKRTRKILQSEGLTGSGSSGPSYDTSIALYPTSRVIPHLDTRRWSPRVAVRYFDNKKGKGLIATEDIAQGETMWREDPFIIAPEWEIYDLQTSSVACAFCTTPLIPDSPLVLSCPSTSTSSMASSSTHRCNVRFCNRLCQSRSAKTHPLLCPTQNPASIPLLKFASEARWMALHAVTQMTSRILLANQQQNDFGVDAEWLFIKALAEMGMEERYKYSFKSPGHGEPDREIWKRAYELYLQAFKEPKTPLEQKKLGRLLKKHLRSDIEQDLFTYNGFLRSLGKMNLNLEAHGGLYTLHSHLNHHCEPNLSVRHLDQRNALARITVLAKRDIRMGEELFVSYVDPSMSLRARRAGLEAWGFGECRCSRCVGVEGAATAGGEVKDDMMESLERELKAGLGVM
ncbi:hypothetical protein AMATHDRAFT_158045 [Amanita thiersii Skay4041]|uniref:Histone-lysine N-methyltransferase SET5 n=1 Tax=Amanita thiersii Skay4041 TaxID=703135 RepID=A0A2A9NBU3_9AGAR|nr:hypothetical protein AMATHDRAFT_158045 [Amanita thiersii Skay4041]